MLRDVTDSLDTVDWLLALGLCAATCFEFIFALQVGELGVLLWGWKGRLLQLAAGGAVGFAGATILAGFVLRSRVVYVLLIVASLLGVLSIAFALPALGVLYGLLRERGRLAFFHPELLEEVVPVAEPVAPQDAATQAFRRRSFEQDQTVLMHGASLSESGFEPASVPEPTQELELDDHSVPDRLDVVSAWLLVAYGLFTGLVGLLFFIIALLWLVDSGPSADGELQIFGLWAGGSLPFFLTSAGCWAMWKGFYARQQWHWVLGLTLALSMLGTGNLPLGLLLLFCLLRKRGWRGFGMARLERRLGLGAAA